MGPWWVVPCKCRRLLAVSSWNLSIRWSQTRVRHFRALSSNSALSSLNQGYRKWLQIPICPYQFNRGWELSRLIYQSTSKDPRMSWLNSSKALRQAQKVKISVPISNCWILPLKTWWILELDKSSTCLKLLLETQITTSLRLCPTPSFLRYPTAAVRSRLKV